MFTFFTNQKWRFINQSMFMKGRSPLESFAMDDTLCHVVGHFQSESVVRTWVHARSVVLGIQDHRLPYIQQAMTLLQSKGYEPIVRNSGGLAVVLDEGVLNLSIVFPDDKKTSIDTAFDYMVTFVRHLFPEIAERIEAYEIVGSYCPGTYDLSVDGKKFAGISQRRMQSGIAVQIYLCIEGSGEERAELIRAFYEQGLQQEQTKFVYPQVKPEVMTSLEQVIGQHLTVQDVNDRVQRVLQQLSQMEERELHDEEQQLFTHYYRRIIERNKSMLQK